jgi:hypothetical protein
VTTSAEGGLTGYADGGEVKTYAGDYGSVTSEGNVQGIIRDLSDMQLQQAKEAALNARDEEQMQMIDAEIARRAALRSNQPQQFAGIAPALSEEFADGMEQSMATGGIVAFADRGEVKEMPEKATSPIGEFLESIGVTGGLNALREGYYKSREQEKREDAAEDIYPDKYLSTESLRPSERTRREAAGNTLFKGPQNVKPMTPEEIEAANAQIMGESKKASGKAESVAVSEPPKETPAVEKKAAKPRFEDITAGPKPSKKEVKSAVAQFAEQNNLSQNEKEDAMTAALKVRDELGKPYQPILDKLNAAIEAQKPNEQAMKDRGLAQALTQFGFGMAERASKPGARFLESASGAAPVIGTVVAETNKLIEAKKDNYAKMQLDQAKYEVALSQGNMQIAATMAAEIRRSQQQDKLLDFNIAKAKDELALKERELAQQAANQAQMLGRYETIGSLTRDIMRNEGLPYPQALEKAARLHRPTGYAADVRSDAATKIALAKELDVVEKTYPAMVRSGKSKFAQDQQRLYEAAINRVYSVYGGAGTTASSGTEASGVQDGFGEMKVK